MANIRDFKTRDEIIIAIKGEPGAPVRKRRRRKGMPETSKTTEGILKRRTKKTPAVLRFFDLGKPIAGPTRHVTHFGNVSGGRPDGTIDIPSYVTTIKSIQDLYLTVDPATLFTTYTKIVAGSSMSRTVYTRKTGQVDDIALDDQPEFSGDTLELTAEEVTTLFIRGDAIFFSSDGVKFDELIPDNGFKVTLLPMYTATHVPFVTGAKMDIAIMPGFTEETSQVAFRSGGPGSTAVSQALNFIQTIIDRNLAPFAPASGLGYHFFHEMWRFMRASPDARAYSDFATGSWGTIAVSEFAPPAKFPPPPATGPAASSVIEQIRLLTNSVPEGTLKVIVKKGDVYFYIWNAFNPGGGPIIPNP